MQGSAAPEPEIHLGPSRKTEVQRLMGVAGPHFPRHACSVPLRARSSSITPARRPSSAEVPGAASYRFEWTHESAGAWSDPSPGITVKDPVANFQFVGAQPGQWRVWAVDASGQEGAKSEWREFRYPRERRLVKHRSLSVAAPCVTLDREPPPSGSGASFFARYRMSSAKGIIRRYPPCIQARYGT